MGEAVAFAPLAEGLETPFRISPELLNDLIAVVNEISAMDGFTNSVGLFFTAVAVNDMSGEITVETQQGEGTTFRVTLPKRIEALRNLLPS